MFDSKWNDHVQMKLDQGFQNYELVLENIIYKKDEDRNAEEQKMYEEMTEIQKMVDDYNIMIENNKQRIVDVQKELGKKK